MIEEQGRRIVKRTATFVGWRLHLRLRNPFYDERLARLSEAEKYEDHSKPALTASGDPSEGEVEGEEEAPEYEEEKSPEVQLSAEAASLAAVYDHKREFVDVEDDTMWRTIIMDQPWAPPERRKRFAALVRP